MDEQTNEQVDRSVIKKGFSDTQISNGQTDGHTNK